MYGMSKWFYSAIWPHTNWETAKVCLYTNFCACHIVWINLTWYSRQKCQIWESVVICILYLGYASITADCCFFWHYFAIIMVKDLIYHLGIWSISQPCMDFLFPYLSHHIINVPPPPLQPRILLPLFQICSILGVKSIVIIKISTLKNMILWVCTILLISYYYTVREIIQVISIPCYILKQNRVELGIYEG